MLRAAVDKTLFGTSYFQKDSDLILLTTKVSSY